MIFLPVFQYAEIHYRFKYFFSYLKNNQPEILFDAPHRIEPNKDLPLILFIKDAHLYPVEIISVEFIVENNKQIQHYKYFINEWINTQFWDKIFLIKFDKVFKKSLGWFNLKAVVNYSVNGKLQKCTIDNYKTSSKNNLKVYRSKYTLPKLQNSKCGDLHTHSNYTNDQVEFGLSLKSSAILSQSIGLNFFCSTDHSYDLDDEEFNYLKNDPLEIKWKKFLKEVFNFNRTNKNFKIIPGEELSCLNKYGKNIHLLLINQKNLLTGSGDSAEKWFKTKSKYNIVEALKLKDPNSISIAAHPLENVALLQKLLLNRDNWKEEDLLNKNLNGFQILNGITNKSFFDGKKFWINQLLQGRKTFIFAGTDAHGNFNRFRQLKIPFVTIVENSNQLFGSMRTVILNSSLKINDLIKNLKLGNCVITTGPLLHISKNQNLKINCKVISNPEFGNLQSLKIIIGNLDLKTESYIMNKIYDKSIFVNDIKNIKLPLNNKFYIRAELNTTNGEGLLSENICFTNPIFYNY
ncbi:MAG: hypothetical protein O3A55_07100 [Bacteroidetes bacterium]|nr:hypothetical protein [Bacteroidota bacterium]